MAKDPKKFVLSDLDGTLMDSKNEMSEEAKNRLNNLIDQGLQFSIATGRSMISAKRVLKGLNIQHLAIFMDGGVLADFQSEKILKVFALDETISREIINKCQKLDIGPMSITGYDRKNNSSSYLRGDWGDQTNMTPLSNKEILPMIQNELIGMFFNYHQPHYHELLEYIQQKFKGKVNIFHFDDRNEKGEIKDQWFEVTSQLAGKQNMITHFADLMNIKLEDIIYFGDNANDMEVCRIVGKGIAVGNAIDGVKKVASEIIAPNTELGVIKYLENHISELI
jgi:5-amino-6-(5-phospho-D-ribitylamino)uracil phosphatase